MASVNKVTLVGNLGSDPEIQYTRSGNPVCTLSIATTNTYKDKETGEKKSDTEWHRVVLFNRLAEIAGEYLKKGRQVYIEGRNKTRKWQDQQGHDRYTTEVIGNEMQMLGSKPESEDAVPAPMQTPAPPIPEDATHVDGAATSLEQ